MEKRKVTISIGGQPCSFYSDDPDEYIAALEKKANAVMRQTAGFSGSSIRMNALLSVVFLTDELLRAEMEETAETEQKVRKKSAPKAVKTAENEKTQVSVWDLLE
ncbi:MAG: hypothetical protein K5922_05380 [Clostridiales bacterium]|nr:hypothetical protein [Clostridiales bacterium]